MFGPVLSVLQVEFVAEDEIVEIVPNIRMDALNMICVRLPPPPISISFNSPSPTCSYISRCCCCRRRRRAGGFRALLPTDSHQGAALARRGAQEA